MTVPLCEAAYPPGLKWALPPVARPLHTLLEQTAATHGERNALMFLGQATTYAALRQNVEKLAAGLQTLGISKGDRVGLCLPNCPAAVTAYFAVLKTGATVVNMNPLYTAEELHQQVRDSTPKAVITANLEVMYPKLEPLAGGPVPQLVVVDFAAAMPWYLAPLFRLVKRKEIAKVSFRGAVVPYANLLKERPFRPVEVDPDVDIAVLQYTGGTTGTPKGAMLSHTALASNTEQIRLWLGDPAADGERFMAVLPLFHCFAMTAVMNLGIAAGACLYLMPQFDLKGLLKIVRRQGITFMPGVPALFNAIANFPGVKAAWFGRLRYGVCGGAPLPQEVRMRFETLTESSLMEGYGLTEASPVVTCNPRHGGKAGSAGLPLPGTKLEIRAPDAPADGPLPAGETGELWVTGPQLMSGYWNNAEATEDVLQQGWLRTGDVGFVDEEGYLHLTDRLKDIIIVNGYNIYPRTVEEAFYRHLAVEEVTVIGIPHPHKGEVPKAFVKLKNGMNATESELLEHAATHLSPQARPYEVELRQQLPKTLVGKLSRKELVAEERAKRG